jgi:hypothetical protein
MKGKTMYTQYFLDAETREFWSAEHIDSNSWTNTDDAYLFGIEDTGDSTIKLEVNEDRLEGIIAELTDEDIETLVGNSAKADELREEIRQLATDMYGRVRYERVVEDDDEWECETYELKGINTSVSGGVSYGRVRGSKGGWHWSFDSAFDGDTPIDTEDKTGKEIMRELAEAGYDDMQITDLTNEVVEFWARFE